VAQLETRSPATSGPFAAPAMMDVQLNAWRLFEHAPTHFGEVELVTRLHSRELHRSTYGEFATRAQQLMHALDALGLEPLDRVATLAWNSVRHLEAYFAAPCSGRVLHTLNLRLSPAELGYIIGHADDRAILVDTDLLPLLEQVDAAGGLSNVRHVIVLDSTVPSTSIAGRNVVAYEELIASQPAEYPRREIPENTPLGICYTSGTTGRPKGAVYTHRSTFLHSLAATSAAALSIGPQDCVLPVVPMFHANAWGMPYAATLVGAKQVFTGPHLDAASLVDLMDRERVTVAGGVPTIWMAVGDELARTGVKLPHCRHMVCGGSQPPRALIERFRTEFDLPIVQAWGMTETSPLASVAWPKNHMQDWDEERVTDSVRTQAGLPAPLIDVSIRTADGTEAPRDGETMGDLLVRGPWVVASYLHGDGAEQFTEDGYFRTGDIAIGSPDGYFVIADRAKDLIKSGGEWISSVDMEAAIMAMPEVAEAAVIAIPHPKWQERPLACVVPREGASIDVDAVHAHLMSRGFSKWQLPDRVEVIEAIPRTGVGKFDKKVLRARFGA
jgi:fatty-acyl-CoA synthase